MKLFANIDTLENRVLGIYPAENEMVAKRANLATLYQVNNPIGLSDRCIVQIAEIDMTNGEVKALEHKTICNMAQLYEELQKIKEVFNNGAKVTTKEN